MPSRRQVSKTSLEQIFIGFAKQQEEEAATIAGIADANSEGACCRGRCNIALSFRAARAISPQ